MTTSRIISICVCVCVCVLPQHTQGETHQCIPSASQRIVGCYNGEPQTQVQVTGGFNCVPGDEKQLVAVNSFDIFMLQI